MSVNIIIVAHNIRSTFNVGSIFRTSEGFGVSKLIFSGYTPVPSFDGDTRLPHIAKKLSQQIEKTALGTTKSVPFEYSDNIQATFSKLKKIGFRIVALEQSKDSIPLPDYSGYQDICLVLGEEVHGITPDLLKICDDIVEIPMVGHKESFNVSTAVGIALYGLTSNFTT